MLMTRNQKMLLAIIATTVMMGAADAPKVEVIKKALEQLQGTWSVVSAELDGRAVDELKGATLIFRGATVLIMKAPTEGEAICELDPSKMPKELTLSMKGETNKGSPAMPGIYLVDGDNLKLCIAPVSVKASVDTTTGKVYHKTETVGKRPTGFDSKQGLLLLLKRQKPEADQQK